MRGAETTHSGQRGTTYPGSAWTTPYGARRVPLYRIGLVEKRVCLDDLMTDWVCTRLELPCPSEAIVSFTCEIHAFTCFRDNPCATRIQRELFYQPVTSALECSVDWLHTTRNPFPISPRYENPIINGSTMSRGSVHKKRRPASYLQADPRGGTCTTYMLPSMTSFLLK